MKEPRPRFRPAGAVAIMDKDRLGTIYLYTHKGQPAAIGYRGRKTRPDVHVVKTTQSEIESVMRRWLDGLRSERAFRDKCRAARKADEWDRNVVIGRIKKALAKRGFNYSVRGGRGTAWGWIHIDLLPAVDKLLTPAKRREAYRQLSEALGFDTSRTFSANGIGVPASTAHYREYLERAQGKTPTKIADPYWD